MESEDTLKKEVPSDQILQAIASLAGEIANVRQAIDDSRREMKERFARIDAEIDEIKQSQFSFDVRLDRVQAMAHDALNVGHSLSADVKILTAEVRAWVLILTTEEPSTQKIVIAGRRTRDVPIPEAYGRRIG